MSKTIKLTTQEVACVFGVSVMTVWAWRKGTKRQTPLPTLKTSKGAREVRYGKASILAWAAKNLVHVVNEPGKVTGVKNKPGPRARPLLLASLLNTPKSLGSKVTGA